MTNEIYIIISSIIGYLFGCVVTYILCNARKVFNAGFDKGWDACLRFCDEKFRKLMDEAEEDNAEIQRDSTGA